MMALQMTFVIFL